MLGDGGYATKDYLRQLPATVDVVGRMLITGKLYAPPPRRAGRAAGVRPKKGPLLGSPKTLARKRQRLAAPSHRSRGARPSVDGAVAYRLAGAPDPRGGGPPSHAATAPPRPASANRRPPVEAFFTTDLTLSLEAILAQYRERWAVEITIRDSNAFAGFGQDQCRKYERVVGANTLRLVLAAARTLWFVEQTSRTGPCDLQHAIAPGIARKCAPSQLDIVWACREALQDAGVFPIPRFTPALAKNQEEPENALPLAA